jgi:gas vesicle protein
MTEDEFKRMQRQLQNQNFVLVPLDEVKMKEKTNEVSRLKTEMITQMQLDIQRKDELIASANVLIDQLKAEVATLKQDKKEAYEVIKDAVERTVGTYAGMNYTFDDDDAAAYLSWLEWARAHGITGGFTP